MNNEEKILQMLEIIVADINDLKKGQASLEKRPIVLEKGQKQLQSDVSSIKRDLKAVWSDILRIDKKIATQQEEIDSIKY
jgi:hypothetical protein